VTLESIGGALLLGLAVGPTCLIGIGAFYVPLLLSEERRELAGAFRFFIRFSLGRLLGYLAVGAIVGLLVELSREMLSELAWLPAVGELLAGTLMLAFGILKNFPRLSICKKLRENEKNPPAAFVVGLATGLSLCPPFVAAILGAGATGGLLSAVVFFLAFFFGTTVWFIPLTFTGLLSRYAQMRRFADILVLVSGVIFIGLGLFHLLSGTAF
jgi:sulfite exporter TauE/SafE